MIERLQRIARNIQRLRWILFLLAPASAVLVLASVIDNPWLSDDRWMMPGVVALCWSLVLLSVGRLFESVPPPATREMSWFRRLKRSMERGLLWLLGAAMLGLTGAVLLLSWQLLRVWMTS